MLYKMTEWESPVSGWYCGNVDALGKDSNAWWLPARIMNLAPADYIQLLITKYKPDYIHFNKEKVLLSFSWKSQAAMRKFKNDLNAAARRVNFQIEV